MTARSEDRGDEAPDLMDALKDSIERAREQRRDREDRGVQVEARTLSGVHLNVRVSARSHYGGRPYAGPLASVRHSPGLSVEVVLKVGDTLRTLRVAPTDLVTLTDGGAR